MLDYQTVEPDNLVKFNFLKGHLFYHYIQSIPELLDYDLVTVLRYPVERVISLYRFWRLHPPEFTNNKTIHPALRGRVALAKRLTLHEFVSSSEQMIVNSICNSQSRQLCSRHIFEDFHELTAEVIYKDVTGNLNTFTAIGLIEMLPLFYQELHQQFGFHVPDKLLLSNVSDKTEPLWHSADEYRKIVAKIIELNPVDIKIYELYRTQQLERINQ